jgi:hypothetical protein
MARKSAGTAWTWGSNQYGGLGNGTNIKSNIPLEISVACSVLSINEIAEQISATVYPNPNNGYFTLILSDDKGRVEIYNLLGEKIYQSDLTNQKFDIDLSNKTKGIYFAKIYSGQKMKTEKIVIQ